MKPGRIEPEAAALASAGGFVAFALLFVAQGDMPGADVLMGVAAFLVEVIHQSDQESV